MTILEDLNDTPSDYAEIQWHLIGLAHWYALEIYYREIQKDESAAYKARKSASLGEESLKRAYPGNESLEVMRRALEAARQGVARVMEQS
jgi:hypothetical protein